jgi:glycosyltransferase involved in cell wall biosynthesis
MKISICIPTYNRADNLINCLESIVVNEKISLVDFEVCIADNFSNDNTESIVKTYQKKLPINYYKSSNNVGRVRNYLNVVSIASGDFIWLIGDDDLLLPNAIFEINDLISSNQEVEFFYINSFCLASDYLASFDKPFNTKNLPKNMPKFSSWSVDGEMEFMSLINPKISFDFLGGMFLSVFKRENWISNENALSIEALNDKREFSHFDNTFPHVKIFSRAFSNSKAYFYSSPLTINLSGAREWTSLSPLINSVRIVEGLKEFKLNGLSNYKYFMYKNYSLNNFIPDLFKLLFYRGHTGIEYINPVKLIFFNCIYPNFYLSIAYFFLRKIKNKLIRI